MAKLYAMRAAWTNFTHVRVPLYFFPNHSVSEWFWTAAYVALVIGLTFWGATYKGKRNYTRVFGLASISQIPLIVGLAGRNNLISLLTGISYEKLNWLHRVAGRTCVLTAWTHMGAMVGQVGKPVVNPKNLTTATGILALTCISLMFLSSFGVFRRLAYEAFIALHICMGIALLVALYYHRPMYRHWIWASMVIWGFDRAVSFAKAVYANLGRKSDQASVTLLGSNAVRVVAHAPKLKWRAGQHAFLIMPSVARLGLESHPFTMANVPSETGEAVFIVRAHTGFTRRLVEHLQSSEGQVKCFVDGPYGLPPMLDHYAGVLLVAGGTGITYALSHLLGIAKGARAGKSAVATARLVWNVRERDDPISWISPMLGDIAAEGLHVRVDVYLTSYGSGDPTEPALGEHKEGGHPASPTSNPEKEGLSDQSHNGLLVVQRGRADIEAIARSDIADVPRDAGGMAVVVCGPTSLAMDARRAVCRVNSAGAVANGQVPIEFYVETFGW
ncbi:hypothetical protein CC85DRAFT_241440 [Cutaneotrichosporon oleaginosum]|uniref:ferric-chelate reductase (NADPH) n=1 Tax=Cutaneotrichosporon oleaginosum TaxID=879819 RepID=A0A0J0XV58_9TREE|nr:uncharacterized protein CC85DRAFT_241440 [Cutaneotrichosporon oleaginosum]KLT44952.1 hypothetical protein CC85DRAFT_241440 [Cutaneotrichosporon oleaginosum]TXT09641.1 hypothetical protein COLE_03575 [Cutaneotrichosporon oleaginosum]